MEEKQEGLKEVEAEKVETSGTDQPEKELVQLEVEPAEDIEALKARLQKAEEERENLSKAVTRLNKERKLTLEKPEEETYPEWDETSKKFQEQTISKAEKIAEQKAQERIEKSNEKAAVAKFVKENPDVDWNYIVSNYTPIHGRDTVEDILKDLDRAKVLANYERGELADLEAFKKGEKKGKAEANLADKASVSKTTSKTGEGGSSLTPGEINLANKMRVDLKKLAEEDMTKPAEIKL